LADPSADQQNLVAAIGEVSERVALLVREEIELAKAEVTAKLKKGLVGIAVGVTAGLFLVLALLYGLNGLGWLLWYVLPTGHSPNFFWGFFALAVILVLLGVLAGVIAYRVLRTSSPPMPTMAIDEARKIRETVESHAEGTR
jgi:hypothetical protein